MLREAGDSLQNSRFLEEVCSARDHNQLFGAIQLVQGAPI